MINMILDTENGELTLDRFRELTKDLDGSTTLSIMGVTNDIKIYDIDGKVLLLDDQEVDDSDVEEDNEED